MFIQVLHTLGHSARSIPANIEQEYRILLTPGRLEHFSGNVLFLSFIMILYMVVFAIAQIDIRFILGEMFLASFIMFALLALLCPWVKRNNPLELGRWIYRHMWYHTGATCCIASFYALTFAQ